jgi:hypothetical protein
MTRPLHGDCTVRTNGRRRVGAPTWSGLLEELHDRLRRRGQDPMHISGGACPPRNVDVDDLDVHVTVANQGVTAIRGCHVVSVRGHCIEAFRTHDPGTSGQVSGRATIFRRR